MQQAAASPTHVVSNGAGCREARAAKAYLHGVQGVECSNHFAPTKINHLGAGRKVTVANRA